MVSRTKFQPRFLNPRHLEGFGAENLTHSITNFAIMTDDFSACRMASEMYRTLQPGITAMVMSWEHSAMELMDRVSRRIRPNHDLVRVISPEWATKEKLVETLITGRFEEAKLRCTLRTLWCNIRVRRKDGRILTIRFEGMWRKGWSEE